MSFVLTRTRVLIYFGLLFLIAVLRGWQASRVAGEPVVCTEAPCDVNVDYAGLALSAGLGTFLGTFITGTLILLALWGVLKLLNRPKPAA